MSRALGRAFRRVFVGSLSLGIAALSAGAPVARADQGDESAKIDQMIELAREGRAMIRPQAAERLVGFGAPAAARLLDEAGETSRDLARLGKDLVAVLGRFDEPRLRAKLWTALDDRDFPWRPSAAQGLSTTARADELERFDRLAEDPIAAVRRSAVLAYRALETRDRTNVLRALLADPNDRVRRAAAGLLFDLGEEGAIWWLLEELDRGDRYFDLETGRLARTEALAALSERLGDDFGYRLDQAPDSDANRAARANLAAAIDERVAERPTLPPIARASDARPGNRIGLELRSCRRGEFFLRWNDDDHLYVGSGSPVAVELAPGTVAELKAAAAESLAEIGDARFFGAPGCDLEQLHWKPEANERVTTIAISKGPDAVADLRPAALTALVRRLVATLPDARDDDARLDRLRTRVVDALSVLGGPID